MTAQQGTFGLARTSRSPVASARLTGLVGWRLSDQAIQGVLTAAVMVVAARSLGPSRLGELSFVLAISAMLTPIVNTHNQVVVHDLVASASERRSILGASLIYGLLLSLALCVILVAAAGLFIDDSTKRTALIVSATALPATALAFGEGALQADMRGREIAIARSGSSALGAALKLGALVMGAGVIGFVVAASVQLALAAVGLSLFAKRFVVDAFPIRADLARVGNVARRSLPLAVSAFSISIYMLLDQVVLGFMADDAELGRYAAAVRVAIAPVVLPMALMTSASPSLAALRSQDMELYLAQLQRIINVVALAGVVIGTVLAVAAPIIVRVLYGEPFASAAGMLSIVAVADIFVFLSVATGVWFVFEGRQTSYMTRALIGALLNVALLLLLIPRYGGYGAAWAALAAYAYVAVFGNYLDRRTHPILFMVLQSIAPRTLVATFRNELVGRVRAKFASRQGSGS